MRIWVLLIVMFAMSASADQIETKFRNTTDKAISSISVCLSDGMCTNYPVSCAPGEDECAFIFEVPPGYDAYTDFSMSDPVGSVSMSSTDVKMLQECPDVPPPSEPDEPLTNFERFDLNGDGFVQITEASVATTCATHQACD